MELFDTHVHSTVSDGCNTPEEILKKAAQLKMSAIALTDHLDMDIFVLGKREIRKIDPDRMSGAGMDGAYEMLRAVKDRNTTGVKLLIGVELGQAHQFPAESEKWLDEHEYDCVIGSCHAIRGYNDFFHLNYTSPADCDALLEQYFDELKELCEWGGLNVLAHMTYPLRYMGDKADITKHGDAIDRLFRAMIKNNIALEINTQGAGGGERGGKLSPELAEIKRYRELGGRLITVGSDAHSVNELCRGFDEGVAAAVKAGFTECVYYDNKIPNYIKF